MKALLILTLFFIASCAQRPVKVERPETRTPVYHAPVRGVFNKTPRGVFIKTSCSKFVRAVKEGDVVYSGRDIESYGWVVIVNQRDGFVSVYGRLSKPWVKTGERVKDRQVIGKVGRNKDACGVYYELRDAYGKPLKPILR
ncbi:M23 family metallopeptidase [Hydrogenivirga sp. 128-5-R1-1]|uniref:murein hydrolase activator EnvC family protein n=1 Tax=Hydrogenivirga sp. 128-5-R1-1 TaxID=392423 RepID=UPI00015F0D3E|nr:M23 family metallopeptidase [Hydrogenivirga sp. 128-5-R1-1]EDP75782.1 lipoprotein [Hydrogenivirga sp. 128-5-R1-1]